MDKNVAPIIGYLNCLPSIDIAKLSETIGISWDESSLLYTDIYLMMSDLAHNVIDYIIVNITNEDQLSVINHFVSRYLFVFHSSYVCGSEQAGIYHIYEKPTMHKKTSILFKLSSFLYSKSLGFFLIFIITYSALLFSFISLYQVISNSEVMDYGITLTGSVISVILSFAPAEYISQRQRLKPFVGYWKYYVYPETEGDKSLNSRVSLSLPRLVEIRLDNGKLSLHGWQVGRDYNQHFQSTVCDLNYGSSSSPKQHAGSLVYTFSGENDRGETVIEGSTLLNWAIDYRTQRIIRMTGWYAGRKSRIIGNICYQRINKNEFDRLRIANYALFTDNTYSKLC